MSALSPTLHPCAISAPLPFGSFASRCVFLGAYALFDRKKSLRSKADCIWVRRISAREGEDVCIVGSDLRAQALRSRGARHFYFTYHTLTGRIFLLLSNGIVVRLTADKTPSSRCVLTGKMF